MDVRNKKRVRWLGHKSQKGDETFPYTIRGVQELGDVYPITELLNNGSTGSEYHLEWTELKKGSSSPKGPKGPTGLVKQR